MTTAGFLFTVSTTWNVTNEKVEKGWLTCTAQSIASLAAETAKELRETPASREQALNMLREWIKQNKDIRNVRQDEHFLLRFLRHKKYSIPMAQQTILKYLNLRKFYPECVVNLDCEDSKLQDIINNGYIAISPMRDSKGRRVLVYTMSKFKPDQWTCWDMCRVHALIYESLLEDPIDQICGVTHVGDGSGATTAHVTAWNPTDFARIMKWTEHSLPMRHKEFHLINVPTAVKYIIDFAKSRVSSKMANRLHIHSNHKQLHQNIDRACLPTSFGGDIAMQDMITFTKQVLSDQRKKVLGLADMEILSTNGIITSRSKAEDRSLQGSFRKLEID